MLIYFCWNLFALKILFKKPFEKCFRKEKQKRIWKKKNGKGPSQRSTRQLGPVPSPLTPACSFPGPAPRAQRPDRNAPSPPCLLPLTAGPRPSLSLTLGPRMSAGAVSSSLAVVERVSGSRRKSSSRSRFGRDMPTPIKLLPYPAAPSLHLISETEP